MVNLLIGISTHKTLVYMEKVMDDKDEDVVMDEKEVRRIIDECLRQHYKVYDRLAEI